MPPHAVLKGCHKAIWDKTYGRGLELRGVQESTGIPKATLYTYTRNGRGNPTISRYKLLMDVLGLAWPEAPIIELRAGKPCRIPPEFSARLCYWAGLIAGDGTYTKDHGDIRLCTSDLDLAVVFGAMCEELFGVSTKYTEPCELRGGSARTACAAAGWILEGLGIPEKNKQGRIVPNREVLPIGSERAALFLRGLFDTDGAIYYHSGKPEISFSTTCDGVRDYITDDFNYRGIQHHWRTRPPKSVMRKDGQWIHGRHPIHEVTVKAKAGLKAFRPIGFDLARRAKIYRAFLEEYDED